MKNTTRVAKLYTKYLLSIEDEIIKGLHEEEHDEWRNYFKNAIPKSKDYESLREAFEKVQWKFSSYLLDEIISLFYPCLANNHQRRDVISTLEKVKALYDNAIEINFWDRSLEWPVECAVDDAIRETTEEHNGAIKIKQKQMQEYDSLMFSMYLLHDRDITKALPAAVRMSVYKASNQAAQLSRSRESLFSRIFDTAAVRDRERIIYKKEASFLKLSEHKKYARKFLSLLKEV